MGNSPTMPSPDTYNHYYFFDTTAPTASSVYALPASNTPSTLSDTADGTSDDMTDVGQNLAWSDNGGTTTLYGFTASGDPIILTDLGSYYILSDNPSLAGSTVGTVTTTGTYTYCFAQGTLISARSGSCPVERLAVGDPVLTADGTESLVKWIGRQTLQNRIGAPRASLLRIRACALGDGLPHSDLTVTGDHGMILDGYVINASALVNGDSIDWVPSSELPETFTVYHVETENHDVILANGAPSETFIDYRDRRAFDNYQEYLDLYGAERIIPEMAHPRISSQRQLPHSLKTRLGIPDARSGFEEARSA